MEAAASKSESLSYPRQSDLLKKIDAFFDSADRIVERSEKLLMKAKYLIFGLSFFFFLIYEMVHFAHFLFFNWS